MRRQPPQPFRQGHPSQRKTAEIRVAAERLDLPGQLAVDFGEPANAKGRQATIRRDHDEVQIRHVVGVLQSAFTPLHRHVFALERGAVEFHVGLHFTFTGQWADFSFSRDELVPIDNEASYLLKKIPVVTEEFAPGTPQMANKVAGALKNYKLIILRGHGSFATGQTLDEAFHWSFTLEESCQMELAAKLSNELFIEYRGMSGSYTQF